MEQTIVQQHQENFNTLKRAFADGKVCIMDCIEKATGEHVAVICSMYQEGKDIEFTPFARFFNGNPYEMLTSPIEYDLHGTDSEGD